MLKVRLMLRSGQKIDWIEVVDVLAGDGFVSVKMQSGYIATYYDVSLYRVSAM